MVKEGRLRRDRRAAARDAEALEVEECIDGGVAGLADDGGA